MLRRLIMLILIMSLSVQSVWAAAGSMCAHEEGPATQHFGHHSHQHQEDHVGGSGAEGDAGAFHPDCETCHVAGSATLPVETSALSATEPFGEAFGDAPLAFRSHIPPGPEKPDRPSLREPARFADGVMRPGLTDI